MRVKHAVVLLMLFSPLTWAGNMTFQFRNPNFGGNLNNASFLLNSAKAQNLYKDPIMTAILVSKRPQRWIILRRLFNHKFWAAC